MNPRRTVLAPLLALSIAVVLASPAGAASAQLVFAGCQSSAAGGTVVRFRAEKR